MPFENKLIFIINVVHAQSKTFQQYRKVQVKNKSPASQTNVPYSQISQVTNVFFPKNSDYESKRVHTYTSEKDNGLTGLNTKNELTTHQENQVLIILDNTTASATIY